MEAVKEQLAREPKPLPTLTLDPSVKTIDDFRPEHVTLTGYDPHPAIKAELALVGGIVTDSWKEFTAKKPEKAA